MIEDLDALPMVTEIYHRDLTMEHYEIPYLRYPYVSFYTGRGCPGHCVYCLWPQTFTGRRFRVRSVRQRGGRGAPFPGTLSPGGGDLL